MGNQKFHQNCECVIKYQFPAIDRLNVCENRPFSRCLISAESHPKKCDVLLAVGTVQSTIFIRFDYGLFARIFFFFFISLGLPRAFRWMIHIYCLSLFFCSYFRITSFTFLCINGRFNPRMNVTSVYRLSVSDCYLLSSGIDSIVLSMSSMRYPLLNTCTSTGDISIGQQINIRRTRGFQTYPIY